MEAKEILEMLSDSGQPLDIGAVISLIDFQVHEIECDKSLIKSLESDREMIVSIHGRLGLEADESGILLDRLDEVCGDASRYVSVSEELLAYRVYMRSKIVGIAEIVKSSLTTEEYLENLKTMDDGKLLSELERLSGLLSEKMGVPSVVVPPVVESRSMGLARLAEFKV